ncbi:SAM-dependent methyltransferase [Actinomadura miaoliensis]|uniref:SAM-dependent methyltransferase n=1 Tax=Actinomadura miaoliensis TaxID=430685 RepID=A0ABP7WX76_9ACTN
MIERDWYRRVDRSVPHPARMYDYYLGGKDNFEADRKAADEVLRVLPEARLMALENRAFLGRTVRFLAAAGIRQFLDIGTGLPTQGNTNEVAHEVAPDARIVYVDNDPMVLVHARALLADRDEGPTVVVEGDVRDPDAILGHPDVRAIIDFDQPVAVLLVAILHFVRDSEDPAGIVERFKRAMAPGSHLVISHGTQDFDPERSAEAVRPYDSATAPFVTRSGAEIERFFDGLEMVDPGMVRLPLWRPDGDPPPYLDAIWVYGGVGRRT